MIYREQIIKALNEYLDVPSNPEHNGLQVEGKREIERIAFGVSANMALFKEALAFKADMIITHHGLIWDKPQPLTGVFGRRAAFLIKNDINLAAYHLPLDKHPVIGNNACLAKLLALQDVKPFGDYHGTKIGVSGTLPKPENIKNIYELLNGECLAFGKDIISKVAIVSGGAHNMFEQAIEEGADLYITGSRDEYIVEHCREAEINFIAMGHYNSERLGIQSLMEYVNKNFKAQTKFIEVANPF